MGAIMIPVSKLFGMAAVIVITCSSLAYFLPGRPAPLRHALLARTLAGEPASDICRAPAEWARDELTSP